MEKLIVGIIRGSGECETETVISSKSTALEARLDWRNYGLEVIDVFEINFSQSSNQTVLLILRALASEPECLDVLTKLLTSVYKAGVLAHSHR